MGNAIVNDMVGEAVSQPTNEERQRRERLAALAAMRVASGTEVPAEEPTLTVDGVGVFALGTMLAQKAGTVLECKKDKGSGVITVMCSDARHQEMPEWSIMFNEDGRIVDADEQRRQALEQRRVELQQRRQEAQAEKQKERLDYALLCIRDHGGVISRKQLTEILVKKFEVERTTVARFINKQIEAKALYEVNKMIHASDDLALAF